MNNEFQDVSKGIRKIYMAELIRIIAAVVSIICAALTPFLNLDAEEISEAALGLAIFISILAWPVVILGIYALFVNLSGLYIVSKHNKRFANAFKIAIFAIILSVVSGVIMATGRTVSAGILSAAASLAYLSIVLSVMGGAAELSANYPGGEEIALKERKLRVPILVLIIAYVVGALALQLTAVSESIWISMIVSVGASLLSLIVDVLYIRFLAKTREIFTENKAEGMGGEVV